LHLIFFGTSILREKKERERGLPSFDLKEYLPKDDEKSNFFDLEENYDYTEKSVKFGQPSVLLCV
jgi:hypothetical protein